MKKKTRDLRRTSHKSGNPMNQMSPGSMVFHALLALFMVVVILVCVVPMWHVLMSSFSDGMKLLGATDSTPGKAIGLVWWPVGTDGGLNLGAYQLLLKSSYIWEGYRNTLIYVIGSASLGFVLNVIGGYTLSRKTIVERPLAFLVMFTMMFSGGLIPTYMVLRGLGMTGTAWALIIPGCTSGIFMLVTSNAFRSVPEATVEAAQLDGAGHLTMMFKVMLPQAMSMVTVTILNTVIMHWNAWYPASIYVPTKKNLWPLQLWIKEIIAQNANFLQATNPDYNRYLLQYVVIIIATAPILIAFPFFLKYIEKGVAIGGVKE